MIESIKKDGFIWIFYQMDYYCAWMEYTKMACSILRVVGWRRGDFDVFWVTRKHKTLMSLKGFPWWSHTLKGSCDTHSYDDVIHKTGHVIGRVWWRLCIYIKRKCQRRRERKWISPPTTSKYTYRYQFSFFRPWSGVLTTFACGIQRMSCVS